MPKVRWQVIASFPGQDPDINPPNAWVVSNSEDGAWFPFGIEPQGMIIWRRKLCAKPAKRTAADASSPKWSHVPAKDGKVNEGALTAIVVQCIQLIRGKDVDPTRCSADAKSVIRLWRSLGYPNLDAFVLQVRGVSIAAKNSPYPIFARDIRGEGWEGGADRSSSVSTITVQKKWSERLDAARKWFIAGSRSEPESNGRGDAVTDPDEMYR